MAYEHRFGVRVYYEDTDFSGNVYHAAYLKFFERGRTEFLRAEGIHHVELAQVGIAFAVRSMQIEFIGAAHIDDELTVVTRIEAISGARLRLDQTLYRGADLITSAKVLVVAIRTTGEATRLPRLLVERLGAHVGGPGT